MTIVAPHAASSTAIGSPNSAACPGDNSPTSSFQIHRYPTLFELRMCEVDLHKNLPTIVCIDEAR